MANRNTTPLIDINNFQGLYTKTNPEILDPTQLRECKNGDFFTEYGALAKIRGNKRILAGPYEENNAAQKIPWLDFYKFQDLDGEIKRHRLAATGTKIQRVEDDGSLTELGANEPAGLFRTSDRLDRFMYITSQNPFRVGNRGTPRRYDGEKLAEWGITAPGRIETVNEGFEDASTFTAFGCTATDETVTTFRDQSVKMVTNGGTSAYIEKLNQTAFSINNKIIDRAEVAVFIDRTNYRLLATSGRALSIYISSDANPTFQTSIGENWVRYDFQVGQISPGWNVLPLDFSVFPSGTFGQTEGTNNDNDLKSYRFEVVLESGTSLTMYWDHFVSLDQGTLDGSLSGSGTIFPFSSGSTWDYKVTFVDENGVESNAGPASVTVDNSVVGAASVKESFDDSTNFTTNSTNSIATDAAEKTEGAASVRLNKSSTAVNEGHVERSGLTLDMLTGAANSEYSIDIFIPTGSKANLAGTAVSVFFGESGLTDFNRWDIPVDTLDENEWTTVTFSLTNADATSGSVDLTNIDTIRVVFFTVNNSTTQDNLRVDNLSINSSVDYAQIDLTNIPTSDNPAIVKRRLYRTLAGGSEHLFLASINDNTTTTFTDTTSDGALGQITPPEAGGFDDASPPPSAGIFKIWKRTGFLAGDPRNPTLLYFSQFDDIDSWPLINTFEFDEPITGLLRTSLGLIVVTETAYWRVFGDNPDYTIDKVRDNMGCVGPRATGESRLEGWIVDSEGMRLYDLRDTLKISEAIRDRVDAFDKTVIELTHSTHTRQRNSILWFIPNASGVYDTAYSYQYAMDDVRQGWFSELDLPSDLNLLHINEVEDAQGDFHIWAGGDDGMIYELFALDSPNWINSIGAETPINFEIQTKWLRLGQLGIETELASGRLIPYQVELRVHEKDGKGSTWRVQIETNDSPVENDDRRHFNDLTFNFQGGVGLLRLPTKNLIGGEFMRLKVQNNQKDVDVRLYGVRVYFHVRPAQFAVTGHPGGQDGPAPEPDC